MMYNPPSGSTNANASYVGKNVAAGTQGSKVPRLAIEATQREIVECIVKSGQTPTNDDFGQLWKAMKVAAPDPSLVHRGASNGVSVNAIVANLSPKITTLDANALYIISLSGPNTGPVTANLDGTGDKPVVRSNGLALQPKDISRVALLTFDDVNKTFVLVNLAQEFAPPGSGFAGNQQRFGYMPARDVESRLDATFTAQFSGVVLCYSTLNSSPANSNISNGAYISVGGVLYSGSADAVAGSCTSISIAKVAAGQAVTVTSKSTPNQDPIYPVSQYLNYVFIPS